MDLLCRCAILPSSRHCFRLAVSWSRSRSSDRQDAVAKGRHLVRRRGECILFLGNVTPIPESRPDRSVQLILGPSFGPTEILSFPGAFSSPPGPTGSWGTSLGGNGFVGQVQFRPWVQIEGREKRGGLKKSDVIVQWQAYHHVTSRLFHGARASGHRALSTTIGPSRPLTEKQAEVRREKRRHGCLNFHRTVAQTTDSNISPSRLDSHP